MELVSIIIPVYNSETFLKRTINSVLEQSYKNWELLLIDDCSSDNSFKIIEDYCQKDIRINCFRLSINSGAAEARNLGILKAKGDFIAFLDSDDYWHPQKIEKQLNFMIHNKVKFCYTDYYLVDELTNKKTLYKALKNNLVYKDIERFNYIACSTVMLNLMNTKKFYMPNIRNRQDWGLWITVIKNFGKATRLNVPLTIYYKRNSSLSSNKFKMVKYHWFIYYKHLNFCLPKALFYLLINILLHINNFFHNKL